MNLFHVSDLHWSNHWLDEKVRCANQLLAHAEAAEPNLIIVAGDSFDHSVRLEDRGARMAIEFFNKLSRLAPMIFVKGNFSHDRTSIEVLGCVADRYPIHVSVEPEIVLFEPGRENTYPSLRVLPLTENVEINAANALRAIFFTLPYPSSSFLAQMQSMGPEELRIGVSAAITNVMRAFSAVPTPAGIPRILIYHGTVAEARISETQHMMGMDIELRLGDIEACHFDLVCAGHLHYAQHLGGITGGEYHPKVFYPGGMVYESYGDEGGRGAWRHEFQHDRGWTEPPRLKSDFMSITSTPMRIFKVDYTQDDFVSPPDWANEACHVLIQAKIREDEIWRVLDAEWRAMFPHAVSLKVQREIVPVNAVRCEAVRDARNLADKIRGYCEYAGLSLESGLIEKADLIETLGAEAAIEVSLGRFRE